MLNFAFLASEVNGPTESDVLLAQATGESLLYAPRLEGLSAQQIATIANFAAPVPEPSTWAMTLLGLGLLAMKWRRSSRA